MIGDRLIESKKRDGLRKREGMEREWRERKEGERSERER